MERGEQALLEDAILDHGISFSSALFDQLIEGGGECLTATATEGTTGNGVGTGVPVHATHDASVLRHLAPAPVREDPVRDQMRGMSRPPQMQPPVPASPLREQDRLLPMANTARLMASELPKDAKISRDAKLLMQEMVSEFICFVTSEANDFSIAANHKAISPEDITNALDSLDLCCYLPVMETAIKDAPKVFRASASQSTTSSSHPDMQSQPSRDRSADSLGSIEPDALASKTSAMPSTAGSYRSPDWLSDSSMSAGSSLSSSLSASPRNAAACLQASNQHYHQRTAQGPQAAISNSAMGVASHGVSVAPHSAMPNRVAGVSPVVPAAARPYQPTGAAWQHQDPEFIPMPGHAYSHAQPQAHALHNFSSLPRQQNPADPDEYARRNYKRRLGTSWQAPPPL